jgi:ATP-binding cassette subfamily C protein CydC
MIPLLREALAGQARTVRFAILCAMLAALAGVGLLAIAGWFLAGAALAGLAGPVAAQGFNYLIPSAAVRAAAILRTGTRYGERMLGHRAALFALAEVRTGLFRRVAASALGGDAAGRSGTLATRLGADVDALEDAVIRRVATTGAWAAALIGLGASAVIGWGGPLVVAAGLVAMRLAGRGMARAMLPGAEDRAAATHEALLADYADIAGPCADIAVYDMGPALSTHLEGLAAAHEAARHDLARAQAMMTATQTVLAGFVPLGLVLVAHMRAQPPSIPLLALALLAAMAALEPWAGLTMIDMRAHRLRAAQERIAALDSAQATAPASPAVALSEHPTLTLAGLTVTAGQRLRVGGPSGAGKTRLVETLVGLRRDCPQPLAVDGHDPRALGLAALRPAFALAGQDSTLIAGSVRDNLLLARPGLPEGALWDALGVAALDNVVRALPEGLDTWLGGDGARLSGGQKRRLVLARALLAGKPWLVLDEPSEGLDPATEATVIARLDGWLARTGTGLVLVSHRPAMAALAGDRVVDLAPPSTSPAPEMEGVPA